EGAVTIGAALLLRLARTRRLLDAAPRRDLRIDSSFLRVTDKVATCVTPATPKRHARRDGTDHGLASTPHGASLSQPEKENCYEGGSGLPRAPRVARLRARPRRFCAPRLDKDEHRLRALSHRRAAP